jgi:Leucine-rich repeat (LRR) protein
LKRLKKFTISNNKLDSLPGFICSFDSLEVLGIDDLNLAKLPENIGVLSRLQQFSCSRNNLNILPTSFDNLTKLTNVNLSFNNLKMLTDAFTKTTILPQSFYICYNRDIILSELQKKWWGVSDYNNYFGKYCVLEVQHQFKSRPSSFASFVSFNQKTNTVVINSNKLEYAVCSVFDIKGRFLETFFKGFLFPGKNILHINKFNFNSGLHLIKFISGGKEFVIKATSVNPGFN